MLLSLAIRLATRLTAPSGASGTKKRKIEPSFYRGCTVECFILILFPLYFLQICFNSLQKLACLINESANINSSYY